MRSVKFRVAGNTLAQLVAKLTSSAATFVITIIIASQYGAFGYGDFTKIFAYIALFYLLVDFGLNAVYIKQSEKNTIHETSLISVRTLWAVILMFLAMVPLAFLPYDSTTGDGYSAVVKVGILLSLPLILTQGLFVSFNAHFQKKLRYDKTAIATVLGAIVTLSIVYLMTRVAAPISVIMLGYVAGGLVLVVSSYLLSRKTIDYSSISWVKELNQGKRIFMLALPLGMTLVFSAIHFRADVFILAVYRPTVEVGVYGLASKFFEFPLAIATFFMNALYPIIVKKLSDVKNLQNIIRQSLVVLVVVSVVIALFGLIAAPYVTLIKQDFVGSILPFRVLIVSLPLFFVSSLYMWLLIAYDKRWELFTIYCIGMIANVVLNLLFIPRFGAVAAALTTGVSELIILAMLYAAWMRTKNNQDKKVIPQKAS